MDANNGEKGDVFDVEWEILALKQRTRDLLGEIDGLKAKNRSVVARISRLKAEVRGDREEGEEDGWREEEREEVTRAPFDFSQLHKLSAEEIQMFFTRQPTQS